MGFLPSVSLMPRRWRWLRGISLAPEVRLNLWVTCCATIPGRCNRCAKSVLDENSSMSIRAIFTECAYPFWVHIASQLAKTKNWQICYWVGLPDIQSLVTTQFPEIIFHNKHDAVR